MTTALGYEGAGRFPPDVQRPYRRACRSARSRLSPIPACRSSIRACSPMRRDGAFSTNLMWDRAIARPALRHPAGRRVDACRHARSARRSRGIPRPAGDGRERHLHHRGQRAFRARRWRAGLIARTGSGPLALSRRHHLSAHPARGAQFRRSLRAGAGRRGAAAAIPRRWATATKTIFCSMPSAKGWNCRPPSTPHPPSIAAGAADPALGRTDARRAR